MAKNRLEVSVGDEVKNVANAMRKVTAAAFAGAPGTAPSIKGKRKTAQLTFKVTGANEKRSIQSQGRRKILDEAFRRAGPKLETEIKKALEAAIRGIVGIGDSTVKVLGRSVGRAKPMRELEQEGFARFIRSAEGAGEIGLPDPDESLRNLKIALVEAITVDVITRNDGIRIQFSFDQRRLLTLTPHPDRFEGGSRAPFYSWLSLVTGPDFLSGGTPGFELVRARDIKASALQSTSRNSQQADRRNLRRIGIAEGLIRASRTRGNAGELAGVMLRTRARRGGRSPAEAFGGKGQDYRPNPRFEGFWDEWWVRSKGELSRWSQGVMRTAVRQILRG